MFNLPSVWEKVNWPMPTYGVIFTILIFFSSNLSFASIKKTQIGIDGEGSFLFSGPSATAYRLSAGYNVDPKISLFVGAGESRFRYRDFSEDKFEGITIFGSDFIIGGKFFFDNERYLITSIGAGRGESHFRETKKNNVLDSENKRVSFYTLSFGVGVNRLLFKSKNFGMNFAVLETLVRADPSDWPSFIKKKEVIIQPPKIVLGLYYLL